MKYFLIFFLSFYGLHSLGWAQEDDEEFAVDIMEVRAEQAKTAARIQKAGEIELNPLGQIEKLGHKSLDAAAMMDDKVIAILQKSMRESDISKQDPKVMRQMILDKAQGTTFEKIFKKFPKMLDITVDVLRDKEAMASLIGIFKRKEDLKFYGFICIGVFIFGWLLKKKLIDKEWPLLKRMGVSFLISLCLSIASFGYFYNSFHAELSPTFKIIAKHF